MSLIEAMAIVLYAALSAAMIVIAFSLGIVCVALARTVWRDFKRGQ